MNNTLEKAYKGSFNVRISPELHKQAVVFATAHHMSLNNFVENAMRQCLLTIHETTPSSHK